MKKINRVIIDSDSITLNVDGEEVTHIWNGLEFEEHNRKKDLLEMERIVRALERVLITIEVFNTINVDGEEITHIWNGRDFEEHNREKDLLEMERATIAKERGLITMEVFNTIKEGLMA